MKMAVRHSQAVILLAILCVGFTSCVHEWPETDGQMRQVRINVTHALTWDQLDILVSRGATAETSAVRYHFKIYRNDDISAPVTESEFIRSDLRRDDFTTSVYLPAGDYTLYAWSDLADATTSKSHFFDSSDFSTISYCEPYNGNNELRDAFRGVTSFHIDDNTDYNYCVEASLPLERPLARYEFISTDLTEFLKNESSRKMNAPGLDSYRVRMIYTGYMPSTFNNITDKPVDSRTGMSYDAHITLLNGSEARLGFDHVMVNGTESSVAVAMEIYDPENRLIGQVSTINVPTRRSRNTTVRGRFLTSPATGGVTIGPGFNGDYNIEIK